MRLSPKKQFGSSSEKSKYDEFNLFNEATTKINAKLCSWLLQIRGRCQMTFRQGNEFLLLVLIYQVTVVKVMDFLTLTIETAFSYLWRSI